MGRGRYGHGGIVGMCVRVCVEGGGATEAWEAWVHKRGIIIILYHNAT